MKKFFWGYVDLYHFHFASNPTRIQQNEKNSNNNNNNNNKMKDWNADLVLYVIQYLNVLDSNRLSEVSCRFYYLVHEFRRLRGPQMSIVTTPPSSREDMLAKTLMRSATEELSCPPNLALCFNTPRTTTTSIVAEDLMQSLPLNTAILGVVSGSIQSTFPKLDYRSNAGMMLAHLPPEQATIRPFSFELSSNEEDDNHDDDDNWKSVIRDFQSQNNNWNVFLVFACGQETMLAEDFVAALQLAFPQATIVGGICSAGYCSEPTQIWTNSPLSTRETLNSLSSMELMEWYRGLAGTSGFSSAAGRRHNHPNISSWTKQQTVDAIWDLLHKRHYRLKIFQEGAIFGVGLGGNVPVRSVVSRGVQSLTSNTIIPSMNWVIEQASIHYPGDQDYMFVEDEGSPPYHIVHRIRDTNTDQVFKPQQMKKRFGRPDFIGLQRPNGDGFDLHMPHKISSNLDAFVFLLSSPQDRNKPTLEGTRLDFFDLTGEACLEDMEHTMTHLKEHVKDEQLLGAIMISCSARGPTASSLLGRHMADASIFASKFPHVPCLGFYAGGEIGPLALAGKRHSVFRQGQAALQGFTAVFALFVVPKFQFPLEVASLIQDDPIHVSQFVKMQMLRKCR